MEAAAGRPRGAEAPDGQAPRGVQGIAPWMPRRMERDYMAWALRRSRSSAAAVRRPSSGTVRCTFHPYPGGSPESGPGNAFRGLAGARRRRLLRGDGCFEASFDGPRDDSPRDDSPGPDHVTSRCQGRSWWWTFNLQPSTLPTRESWHSICTDGHEAHFPCRGLPGRARPGLCATGAGRRSARAWSAVYGLRELPHNAFRAGEKLTYVVHYGWTPGEAVVN